MKQTLNQLADNVAERLDQKTVAPLSRLVWFYLQKAKKLNQKGRLLELVAEKVAEKKGKKRVVLCSAKPLANMEVGKVGKKLERKFGAEVDIETKTDPSLLGGIKIIAAEEVIDLSWRGKLDDLKEKMTPTPSSTG